MRNPVEIKRALKCVGVQRDEYACTICPYRRSQNCAEKVIKDVEKYIEVLEQRGNIARTSRDSRIRTVYLYTVTDADGSVICKDATSFEAANAMGYAHVSGFRAMWKKQETGGETHGIKITRRKGLIGKKSPAIERVPFFVYTVIDSKGMTVLEMVNARDVYEHYGLTRNGLYSIWRKARTEGHGEIAYYHGDTIKRIKTERGERCAV